MKKEFNITFVLGDPSGDGHANTSEYHAVSNYSVEQITEAYEKATSIAGFDYVEDVCSGYEESMLSREEYLALVEKLNIPTKNLDFLEEYDDGFCLCEGDFIDVFIEIIKSQLPNFYMVNRDLEEDYLTILHGAGYGVAYHGE